MSDSIVCLENYPNVTHTLSRCGGISDALPGKGVDLCTRSSTGVSPVTGTNQRMADKMNRRKGAIPFAERKMLSGIDTTLSMCFLIS